MARQYKDRPLITADELREVLAYSPESGEFRWRRAVGRRAQVGGVAGSVTCKGYWHVRLRGRLYMAHRLAWLYVHGVWPQGQCDHKSGNRLDNRIENLRVVTNAENAQNRRKPLRPTSSKYIGVSWNKAHGRWGAQITLDYKILHLGYFSTEEEAAGAYLSAKSVWHQAQPVPRANAYDRP